ncbi:MAG: chalcone isomerase family protein, partial [Myxococcota bacterium]|nr:chalcone isomerase family protein [Myxococcota bacterium]
MPRPSTPLLLMLILSLAPPAVAGELAGVTLDDTVTDRGATLQLVGMGLRSKLGIKAYALGLYM